MLVNTPNNMAEDVVRAKIIVRKLGLDEGVSRRNGLEIWTGGLWGHFLLTTDSLSSP